MAYIHHTVEINKVGRGSEAVESLLVGKLGMYPR